MQVFDLGALFGHMPGAWGRPLRLVRRSAGVVASKDRKSGHHRGQVGDYLEHFFFVFSFSKGFGEKFFVKTYVGAIYTGLELIGHLKVEMDTP